MERRSKKSHHLAPMVVVLLVVINATSNLALDAGNLDDRFKSYRVEQKQSTSQSISQQRIRLPRRLSSRQNELTLTEQLINSKKKSSSPHALFEGRLGTNATTKLIKNDSTLDDGLLLSSAGNGIEKKDTTSTSNNSDDDDKKTLSQQVKEGKYGLIQNELFSDEPKRPGILSYSSNPEVPRDNVKNLGGLDEDEIWLAEDHVLVIKGGNFPKTDSFIDQPSVWKPIDDYEAPQRQVKIPARPKIPPPFPIQLTEGGPVQLIGINGSNVVENGTIDFEALPEGFQGFLPGEGPYFPLSNLTTTTTIRTRNEVPVKTAKAAGLLPPGGFYASLPRGAVIVPPPSNQTDYDDEDQSMYYPPPYSFVYSQDNSTTDIPPGPLVPGIILPPPPDFFASLPPEEKNKDKYYAKQRLNTTPLPSGKLPPRKSSTKLYKTPSVTATSPIGGSKTSSYSAKGVRPTKFKINATFKPIQQTEKTTVLSYPTTVPFIEVTTPIAIKSTTGTTTTLDNTEPNLIDDSDKYNQIDPIISNQVLDSSSSTTDKPWRAVVNSKPVPLVTFFASTTPSSIEQPVETTPSAIKNVLTTENPINYPSQASYYFYEESNNNNNNNENNNNEDDEWVEQRSNPSSTTTPEPIVFFSTTAESPPPYYNLDISPQQVQQQEHSKDNKDEKKKIYYDFELSLPSQQTKDSYKMKLIDALAKSQPHQQQIYRYLKEIEAKPVLHNPSPRMLPSEQPFYYQPIVPSSTRSLPKLSYFTTTTTTTTKPISSKIYYRKPDGLGLTYGYNKSSTIHKSKPIYQYSFEAANYNKKNRQVGTIDFDDQLDEPELSQKQLPRRQKELPSLYNPYQDIQTVVNEENSQQQQQQQQQQYDYEASDGPVIVADHQFTNNENNYLSKKQERAPNYYHHHHQPQSTTVSSLIRDTTLSSHQQYFTKQDEQLLDEVTKEYFTVFGKKLPSTTPIYGKSSVTEKPLNQYNGNINNNFGSNDYTSNVFSGTPQNVKVHYGDHTPGPSFASLKDDMLVNFKRPLPPINSNTEFISVVSPARVYHHHHHSHHPHQQQQHFPIRPISLDADINVNYKQPRPQINPDAEFLPGIGVPTRLDGHKSPPQNSYFSYRLPGDGGHFYFLTPQAINREQDAASYLYSNRPRASAATSSRLLRRRRARDSNRESS